MFKWAKYTYSRVRRMLAKNIQGFLQCYDDYFFVVPLNAFSFVFLWKPTLILEKNYVFGAPFTNMVSYLALAWKLTESS